MPDLTRNVKHSGKLEIELDAGCLAMVGRAVPSPPMLGCNPEWRGRDTAPYQPNIPRQRTGSSKPGFLDLVALEGRISMSTPRATGDPLACFLGMPVVILHYLTQPHGGIL